MKGHGFADSAGLADNRETRRLVQHGPKPGTEGGVIVYDEEADGALHAVPLKGMRTMICVP